MLNQNQVRRGENGQNLIELALLTPFVVVFIGAIVIFGVALNTRSGLQQAVRETARQVAVGVPEASAKATGAGNAGESIDSSNLIVCYPIDTDGSQGKVGDPVRVYVRDDDGTEGFKFNIIEAGGLLKVFGSPDLSIRMSPRATSRLEKSVTAPANC